MQTSLMLSEHCRVVNKNHTMVVGGGGKNLGYEKEGWRAGTSTTWLICLSEGGGEGSVGGESASFLMEHEFHSTGR